MSGLVELALHLAGEDALKSFVLNKPVVGELLAGLVGMVPNCAVSVAFAQLYMDGGMSAGSLMAGSLAGSGLGLLVLFGHSRQTVTLVYQQAVTIHPVVKSGEGFDDFVLYFVDCHVCRLSLVFSRWYLNIYHARTRAKS